MGDRQGERTLAQQHGQGRDGRLERSLTLGGPCQRGRLQAHSGKRTLYFSTSCQLGTPVFLPRGAYCTLIEAKSFCGVPLGPLTVTAASEGSQLWDASVCMLRVLSVLAVEVARSLNALPNVSGSDDLPPTKQYLQTSLLSSGVLLVSLPPPRFCSHICRSSTSLHQPRIPSL